MGSTVILLKNEPHASQVINILHGKHSLELTFIGRDGDLVNSDKLLLVSPFLRSLVDHQNSLEDNVLILPDFSGDDIKEGFAILESNRGEDLVFSNTTKTLLESLGVHLKNTGLLENALNFVENQEVRNIITFDNGQGREDEEEDKDGREEEDNLEEEDGDWEKEDMREKLDEEDEDEEDNLDEIQKILLDQNRDLSDDEEEAEGIKQTVKVEECNDNDDNSGNEDEDAFSRLLFDSDPEDIQNGQSNETNAETFDKDFEDLENHEQLDSNDKERRERAAIKKTKNFKEKWVVPRRSQRNLNKVDYADKVEEQSFRNKRNVESSQDKQRSELETDSSEKQTCDYNFGILSNGEQEEGREFPCRFCPSTYPSENLLNNHKHFYHKIPLNKLPPNFKVSPSAKLREESEEKAYQCNLCYKTFRVEKYLKNHQDNIHKDHAEYLNRDIKETELEFSCQSCDKKFALVDFLEYHKKVKHRDLKCLFVKSPVFCKEKFNNSRDRDEHCRTAHGKQDEPVGTNSLKCLVCQKIVKKMNLPAHKSRHATTRTFECLKCHANFSGKSNLRIHERKPHRYKCVTCNFKFINKERLLNHQAKKCGRGITEDVTKDILVAQTRKEHPNSSGYSNTKDQTYCILCYRDYSSASNLNQHRLRLHKTEQEMRTFIRTKLAEDQLHFPCVHCGKNFLLEHILDHHVRYSHSSKKRGFVSCQYCDRQFKWKNRKNLKTHIKNIHQEEIEENDAVKNYMSIFEF